MRERKMKRFKQFREEMTPQMKKAVKTIAKPKYGVSNYDTASDKGGSLDSMGGTPRKDQSAFPTGSSFFSALARSSSKRSSIILIYSLLIVFSD